MCLPFVYRSIYYWHHQNQNEFSMNDILFPKYFSHSIFFVCLFVCNVILFFTQSFNVLFHWFSLMLYISEEKKNTFKHTHTHMHVHIEFIGRSFFLLLPLTKTKRNDNILFFLLRLSWKTTILFQNYLQSRANKNKKKSSTINKKNKKRT